MIEIEQDCQEKRKGNSQEDVSNVKVPETHQPRSVQRGEKCFAGRKHGDMDIFHMADVDEASEEYDDQRRAIVFEELPHVSTEEVAVTQLSTDPCSHQYKKRYHNRQVGRGFADRAPLTGQDLNTFLEVDTGNVEPEDITREASHVF